MNEPTEPTDWPTTKRYPRTLQQAFPNDREWAYCCERPRRFSVQAIARAALPAAAILMLVGMVAHTLVNWAAQWAS